MSKIFILGIESSCDDTSISIVDENRKVVAFDTVNQTAIHKVFGGVIPEIAARNHIAWIFPLLDKVFKQSNLSKEDISAIAVTTHPGLVGSLLVGVSVAKGLALGWQKPLISVNHLDGHIYSAFLETKNLPENPYLALIVSGGHTSLIEIENNKKTILGETMDDAAGEAFDKVAKMAKIGYPGGPIIDKMAQQGNPKNYKLPFLLKNNNKYKNEIIFSFSGIKTAVRTILEKEENPNLNDLMASFQNRVIELIERKLKLAFSLKKYKALVVAGGVSANSELRKVVTKIANKEKIELFLPQLKYCQDNGAMIACAGLEPFAKKDFTTLDADVSPTTRIKR